MRGAREGRAGEGGRGRRARGGGGRAGGSAGGARRGLGGARARSSRRRGGGGGAGGAGRARARRPRLRPRPASPRRPRAAWPALGGCTWRGSASSLGWVRPGRPRGARREGSFALGSRAGAPVPVSSSRAAQGNVFRPNSRLNFAHGDGGRMDEKSTSACDRGDLERE